MDTTWPALPASKPLAKRGALIAAVTLHVILVTALVTGTAHRIVSAVIQPVKVALLDEPERPPPPEPVALPPPPTIELPPPVFVPPPEVHIARPNPPPITVRSTPVPPPLAAIAPPAPPRPSAPVPKLAPRPNPLPAKDLSRPAKIVVAQCNRPTYPAAARREEATGTSRIRFEIDARGQVVNAEIMQRSGRSRAHRQLDRSAVEALSQCQFTPGRDKQGHPTGGYASVEYVWRLE